MRHFSRFSALLFSFIFFAGCAISPTSQPTSNPESKACTGGVISPPAGLVEVKDKDLLHSVLGDPGKGMLCKGKVFVAVKPVVVYRVWDSSKTYTALGRWWSLRIPKGPKTQYQLKNGICPAWSALDRMSKCTLKKGAHVVIGPGQSAECLGELYPSSAVNQVYVPNDAQKHQVFVERCTSGVAWP